MFKWVKKALKSLVTGKREEVKEHTPIERMRATDRIQGDKDHWEEIQKRIAAQREQERVDMLFQRAIDTALKIQQKEQRKEQYRVWVENNSRIFAAKEVKNNVVTFPTRIAV